MFSVGIIGLPNAGKSTLFKALTNLSVNISPYPFSTIDPNKGIVPIFDERLEKIAKAVKPLKKTPPAIEFIDVAGLIKGAHKGEGLGNQFLSYLEGVDLLLLVTRAFENQKVSHPEKSIDPKRDIEIVKEEILLRDKKVIEKFLSKLKPSLLIQNEEKRKEKEIGERLLKLIEEGKWLFEEMEKFEEKEKAFKLASSLGLISSKPILYLFNIGANKEEFEGLALNLKEEEEISSLSEEEKRELGVSSHLDQLIKACYNKLDLITFYTIAGGKEVRGWELKRGEKVIEAGGKVHSDFKEKFIKAEVLSFNDFLKTLSWNEAKKRGLVKVKGKDYIVKDGDIIEFKI